MPFWHAALGQRLLHYDWPNVPKFPMTTFAFPLDWPKLPKFPTTTFAFLLDNI
jgi:hypothetical protein